MPSEVSPATVNVDHRTVLIRSPPHTYFHLTLLSASAPSLSSSSTVANGPPTIDILTARNHFSSALQQYLGLTGSAIPIDILKIQGRDCWIRVPGEDRTAVTGALSQRVSNDGGGVAWRIRSRGEWLGRVAAGTGVDLFDP